MGLDFSLNKLYSQYDLTLCLDLNWSNMKNESKDLFQRIYLSKSQSQLIVAINYSQRSKLMNVSPKGSMQQQHQRPEAQHQLADHRARTSNGGASGGPGPDPIADD